MHGCSLLGRNFLVGYIGQRGRPRASFVGIGLVNGTFGRFVLSLVIMAILNSYSFVTGGSRVAGMSRVFGSLVLAFYTGKDHHGGSIIFIFSIMFDVIDGSRFLVQIRGLGRTTVGGTTAVGTTVRGSEERGEPLGGVDLVRTKFSLGLGFRLR